MRDNIIHPTHISEVDASVKKSDWADAERVEDEDEP
jgi:hypothetical protein